MKILSLIFALMLVCLFFLAEHSSNVYAQEVIDENINSALHDSTNEALNLDSFENADEEVANIINEESKITDVEMRSD